MEGKNASCMLQFKGEAKLTSEEFVKVFKEFDKDGNGFIEADELTDFLVALLSETGNENPNEEELIEFKQFILDKFDDNFDGKISMPELENILPTEENYLAQFRDEFQANKMDSVQFIKIWNHYDSDMSGYLEGDEIDAFLRDMLQQQGCNANTQLIKDFKQFIMDHHDDNKDGKIGLKELSSILPKEENFFAKFQGKPALSREDFDAVFDHYDADNSGEIDASELLVLLRDVMKKMKLEPDSAQELEKMRDVVLGVSDKNNDGKLSRGELALLLSDVN
ncbi:calretinin-like [Montipora foliosa]|uniref:calretinin-like n=1 Tax=Montipora foliosa TaxID=591990 RepID=UPI0035F1EB75